MSTAAWIIKGTCIAIGGIVGGPVGAIVGGLLGTSFGRTVDGAYSADANDADTQNPSSDTDQSNFDFDSSFFF